MAARTRAGRSGRGHGCLTALITLALLAFAAPASVFLALGLLPALQVLGSGWWTNKLAMLASFIPLGWPLWVSATLCSLLVLGLVHGRSRLAAGLIAMACVCGLVVQTTWLAPHYLGRVPEVAHPMRVVTLNVFSGAANPETIVAATRDADIVVLTETSPWAINRLNDAGIRQRFAHVLDDVPVDRAGTAVYTRYPIISHREIDYGYQQRIVELETPDHGRVTLAAYRPRNPSQNARQWSAEGRMMAEEMAPLVARGPVIMAGDFNAVNQHLVMQRFFDLGLRDAAEDANAGWQPTWPANRRFPPLVEIDHVLVSGALHASSLRTFRVQGSDHLGLIAEVG